MRFSLMAIGTPFAVFGAALTLTGLTGYLNSLGIGVVLFIIGIKKRF